MTDNQNETGGRKKKASSSPPPPYLPMSWPALIWAILVEPRVWLVLAVVAAVTGILAVGLSLAGYDPLALVGIPHKVAQSKGSDVKIEYFSRYMQIRSWLDWTKTAKAEGAIYDRVVHEDTILLEPIDHPIVLKDRSTVRGKIFVDYILGGKLQITNREEYEDWSNRSIIEYQIAIAPGDRHNTPIVRRRFSYENNLPRDSRSPSQAGLRVPADASAVETIIDFSFLEKSLWPNRVDCKIGVPSEKGVLQERINTAESLGPERSMFHCEDKNLPEGSQIIFQWFWPEQPGGRG